MGKAKTTPILGGAYLVVGVVPGPIGTPIGEVDLSRIDVGTADRLIALRVPYLEKATLQKPAKRRKA